LVATKDSNYATKDSNYDNQGSQTNYDNQGKAESTSETLMQKRKRVNKKRASPLSSEKIQASPRKKKRVAKPNTMSHVAYTVATVMATWDDATEYGISFRQLNTDEQEAEVQRLNTVTKKGHKDIVKQKIIDVNFKAMVAEKMRAHLMESRLPLHTVYHSAPLIDRTRVMKSNRWELRALLCKSCEGENKPIAPPCTSTIWFVSYKCFYSRQQATGVTKVR
jgi:hypothetical protein